MSDQQFTLNENYITQWLERLLLTPSPSGYCRHIVQLLKEELTSLGYTVETTPKGNMIVSVEGEDRDHTLAYTAHLDTLGAMVRAIKSNGMLRITPIGGYLMQTVEGEYCTIHTRDGRTFEGTVLSTKPSVHVYSDAKEWKREEANIEIRIDELTSSKQETEALGIAVGDIVSWDPRTKVFANGFVKSRHLDDKASVAALLGLLEALKRQSIKPTRTTKFIFSTYEEVGHGSAHIPADIVEMIAVDMGALGDDLSATELDVSICAKDSSGPYDYEMVSSLVRLAEREQLPYAVDIYPHYGSDASAALRAGSNIRAALIGPGVHASHGMERTHMQAVTNTTKLLYAYMMEDFLAI